MCACIQCIHAYKHVRCMYALWGKFGPLLSNSLPLQCKIYQVWVTDKSALGEKQGEKQDVVRGLTATAASYYIILMHDLSNNSYRSGTLWDSAGFLLLDAVLCNVFLSLLINLAPIQYMYVHRARSLGCTVWQLCYYGNHSTFDQSITLTRHSRSALIVSGEVYTNLH